MESDLDSDPHNRVVDAVKVISYMIVFSLSQVLVGASSLTCNHNKQAPITSPNITISATPQYHNITKHLPQCHPNLPPSPPKPHSYPLRRAFSQHSRSHQHGGSKTSRRATNTAISVTQYYSRSSTSSPSPRGNTTTLCTHHKHYDMSPSRLIHSIGRRRKGRGERWGRKLRC